MTSVLALIDLAVLAWAALSHNLGDPVFTVPVKVALACLVLTGCSLYKDHLDEIRYRQSRRYLDEH